MKKIFSHYKLLFLSAALLLSFSVGQNVVSQHEGHTMPGMSKPKPKAKTKARRQVRRRAPLRTKKPVARRKQPVKKHDRANMRGTTVRQTPSARPASTAPHVHTPGMPMPATTPKPATTDLHPHSPGTPTAAPESVPTASPQKTEPHVHTPGMPMPASPATPTASPDTTKPHVHTPAAETSPSPHPAGHQAADHPMDTSGGETGAMNMGPLLAMSGDNMGIRVGASDTNILLMGAMGSGTSLLPATTPQHMIHKQSGDWLLMFHYNAFVGVNSQGGPRGVTKFESANWFMPMAFRKVGPGTLQLRGMFSFEPFTFPPGGSPLLFQTGETYKGRPIIDAQHPHDLFMELSATYTVPLGDRATRHNRASSIVPYWH